MATVRYGKSISVDPSRSPRQDLSKSNRLEDLFICSYCYELYDENNQAKLPKTLPCLHSFCAACIDRCYKSALEERRPFDCPTCGQKADALSVPVNTDILRFIRSKTEYCHAACPSCLNMRSLEACFDCSQPVCSECLENHFGTWKEQSDKVITDHRKQLEVFLTNIETLKPIVDNNNKKLKEIESQVEFRYQSIIDALNVEKRNLINSLNTIKSEQEKYQQFKDLLRKTILDMNKAQAENQKYEKIEMMSRKEKRKFLQEEFSRSRSDFNEFIKRPFAIIDSLADSNKTLLGELKIEEIYPIKTFEIPTSPVSAKICTRTVSAPILQANISGGNIFSALNTQLAVFNDDNKKMESTLAASNSNISSTTNNCEEALRKFINCSKNDPEFEIMIDHAPSHMTSYKNLLFVCEEYGKLTIFELTSDVVCNKKSTQKLNFTNIRSIAVNSKYFGVTYSYLTKDDIKKYNKKMPMNGIALFRRNEDKVCNNMETFIQLQDKGGFISPRGLALYEDYIFVSDINLAKVFKLNFAGVVIQAFSFDGKVFDISINPKFMLVTDYTAHELNLLDIERMTMIKRAQISQTNKFDYGPYNVELTKENLVFFVNSTRTEISLYDINLTFKATFSVKFCSIQNITVLDSPNQLLIAGSKTNNNKYKLSFFIPES